MQKKTTNKSISRLGYRDDSPYRFNPYNVINSGNITMDGVSTPLLAINNGQVHYLPPNSGSYKFKGKKTVEIPFLQQGGTQGRIEELERARQLDMMKNLNNIVPVNNYAATLRPDEVNPITGQGTFVQPTNDIKTQTVPSEVPTPKPMGAGISTESALAGARLPNEIQSYLNSQQPPSTTYKPQPTPKVPSGVGSGIMQGIVPAQQLLLGAARAFDNNKQIAAAQQRMEDSEFNPTFQYVENDYGSEYQEGGNVGEFDTYDFLFDESEEIDTKVEENNQIIEQQAADNELLRLQAEQQDEEYLNNLALEEAMADSPRSRMNILQDDEVADYGSAASVAAPKNLMDRAVDYRNYAMQLGLSKEEASGLIGNGIVESGLNATVLGKADNMGSRGLFQPHSERLTALKEYAASQNKDWKDPYVQIEQAVRELNSTHKAARGSFGSATEAAKSIMNKFEKPAEWAKRRSFGQRAGYAEALMKY